MSLPPERLMALHAEGEIVYSEEDAILYALGVGLGADPLDPRQLAFAYEKDLKVLPSFAATLSLRAPPLAMGLNWLSLVHGEQRLKIHHPLPAGAMLKATSRVIGVSDKGQEKGALIFVETILTDSGRALATLLATIFARSDGGGGSAGSEPTALSAPPTRSADACISVPTRPDQAVLYRLTGDRNPIHIDPAIARAAGFSRPILHGLCTYGIACRSVIQAFCNFDPARILQIDARFSAPVFPGETISVNMWREGDEVSFEALVEARSAKVLENGRAVLAT